MHLGVLRNLISLRREQWADIETIQASQSARLRTILGAAAATEYYENIPPSAELEELEPTPKMDFRRNRESFLHPDFKGKKLRTVSTSGSSGIPIRVSMDSASNEYRKALLLHIQLEQGILPPSLTVRVESAPDVRPPQVVSSGLIYRTLLLHSSMSEKDMLKEIQARKADYMCVYPSIAYSLAKENRNYGVKVKSFVCGGEVLSEETRKIVSESFSCPVFNKYSCWESGPIAWECPEEHSLHVDAATILEIVDPKGRPVKSGMGRVLLTSLHNRAMPLIRYELGDYASWGEQCACGRGLPVLKEVHGRTTEFITLPSGKNRPALSMNVHRIEGVLEGTLHHQLVQKEPGLFVFKYVPFGPGLDSKTEKQVRAKILAACEGEDVSLEFEVVDKIHRDKSGKLKRVLSLVKSDV